MVPIGFAERLRQLREAAGLTQAQLAELSGMHRQSVVKLERGENGPTWEKVIALAEALRLTPNDFLPPRPKRKRGKP